MELNIAICDDNQKICADIKNLILKQIPDAKICIFSSKNALLQSKENFQIFFLDIKAVNGIEIAKVLRKRQEITNLPKIILIFITGYGEFMPEAFDVHAFHYLLKPIEEEKFLQVLSQAVKEFQNAKFQAENFILVKIDGIMKKILLKDIFYVESQNTKVAIHTTNGIFKPYRSMDSFENSLGETFFRCHRFYIVNLAKISAYTSDSIQLCNGEKIFISSRRYRNFVKAFLRYANDGGIVNV